MEKVQSYEEAFAKIQKATKITDIDELVQTFINAEDQNFSLFNYVNDLSNEIEKLEEKITNTETEIQMYKGDGADPQRKQILQELEGQLSETESKTTVYEAKYSQAMKTVAALKRGIQSIFNKIGCDNKVVSEMLGSQGVVESNMMQYLGIIEQRTNELLQAYDQTVDDEDAMEGTQEVPMASTIAINAPSAMEASRVLAVAVAVAVIVG